jgi:uncharacterized membrane protein
MRAAAVRVKGGRHRSTLWRVIWFIVAGAILATMAPGSHAQSARSESAQSESAQSQSAGSAPVAAVTADDLAGAGLSGWHRSLVKSVSYQAIVVTTDQVLYWTIITGAAASDAAFFVTNAVSGVAYYVAFDAVWGMLDPAGVGAADPLHPGGAGDAVSLSKALVYRVFDTARVMAVTLAVGTPLAGSLEVAAASAAVRTGVYIVHDYVWTLVPGRR